MGKFKKIIGGTFAIMCLIGLYKFVGLRWTIIITIIAVTFFVIIKLAKGKESEEEDEGGYFGGIFTD